MKIQHIDSTPSRQLSSKKTGEHFSVSKSLNEPYDISALLVHHETLLPGKRASAEHYHTLKDEIFYVLEGRPTIVVDGVKTVLSKGDYIGFSAQLNNTHMLINESDESAVILTIGTNPHADQVHYSDE